MLCLRIDKPVRLCAIAQLQCDEPLLNVLMPRGRENLMSAGMVKSFALQQCQGLLARGVSLRANGLTRVGKRRRQQN